MEEGIEKGCQEYIDAFLKTAAPRIQEFTRRTWYMGACEMLHIVSKALENDSTIEERKRIRETTTKIQVDFIMEEIKKLMDRNGAENDRRT